MKKISHLVLTLMGNIKKKVGVFFKFCGLLTLSELYGWLVQQQHQTENLIRTENLLWNFSIFMEKSLCLASHQIVFHDEDVFKGRGRVGFDFTLAF